MAMDYPNPLHWDERFAHDSRFGGMVAPQSFAVALDFGHGAAPACVGRIPNSHLSSAGRNGGSTGAGAPGRLLVQERRFHDYKVIDTKFAGPTMFSRGDTTTEPARYPRRPRAVDRDPLPLRRSNKARDVRESARRDQTLDAA